MMDLKLKVCGMKHAADIEKLVMLQPDFIGFIFYRKSGRFIEDLDPEIVRSIPKQIKRVGVFVNEELEQVVGAGARYELDYVQLHGDEDLAFCQALRDEGVNIIKVFRVSNELPQELGEFEAVSDYFLFDTATSLYGGSGKHFDWNILEKYSYETPYLLSGGISLDDLEEISRRSFPSMVGVDVNSKFERSPGVKNIELLTKLKATI